MKSRCLIISIVVLLTGIGFLIRQNNILQADCDQQSGNVETLMDTVKRYKVRDSLNIASVSTLNLTVDELKKYRVSDAKLIKDLGIKNKNLESIIKTGIHTTDTIPVDRWHSAPNNPDCLEYSDKWVTVTACFKDSTVMYSVRDSLAMVVYRIPKKRFLWWTWGTKGYKVEVVNFNPRSEIGYSETIRIHK